MGARPRSTPLTHWRLTAGAERDFDGIATYLDKNAVQGTAVAKLVQALLSAFDLLASSPEIGSLRPNLGSGIRSWLVVPYVIFYRVRPDGVIISRILHQHRNSSRAFRRMP